MPVLKPSKPAGSRSNRMLTQRVVNQLGDFFIFSDKTKIVKKIYGPIRVNYNASSFEVFIQGNLILNINKEKQEVLVTNGGHFDKYGNPSSSTRELINGIFDTLEAHNITHHVRAHLTEIGCVLSVIGDQLLSQTLLDRQHQYTIVFFKK